MECAVKKEVNNKLKTNKLYQNVGKISQKMRNLGKLMQSGHNWSKKQSKKLKLGCQIDIEKLQKQIKSSQIVCQKWM